MVQQTSIQTHDPLEASRRRLLEHYLDPDPNLRRLAASRTCWTCAKVTLLLLGIFVGGLAAIHWFLF